MCWVRILFLSHRSSRVSIGQYSKFSPDSVGIVSQRVRSSLLSSVDEKNCFIFISKCPSRLWHSTVYLLFNENLPKSRGGRKDRDQWFVQRSHFIHLPTLSLSQQHRPGFDIIRSKFHCLLSSNQSLVAPFLCTRKKMKNHKIRLTSIQRAECIDRCKFCMSITMSILIWSFRNILMSAAWIFRVNNK